MSYAAGEFRDRDISVRGLRYRLRDAGAERDRAVLLLHGFAGSSEDWGDVARALAKADYRAVAVDLPGHGGTPAPRSNPLERYGVEETARDLIALLDALGIPSADWLGYSMGGRIALVAALDHPDRVDTLTLESAGPGIADPAVRSARARADGGMAASIESRGSAWFAAEWAALPIFATQRALPPSVRETLDARRRRNDSAGIADSLRAAGQGVQRYAGGRLAGFGRPTLLVSGSHDAKYTILAAEMEAEMPSALHLVAPDAGHNVHLEQPAWFERTLLTHLRRHGGHVPLEAPTTP